MDTTNVSHPPKPANTSPADAPKHAAERLWKEREEVVRDSYGWTLREGLDDIDSRGDGVARVADGLAAMATLVETFRTGQADTVEGLDVDQLRAMVLTLGFTMRAASDRLRVLQAIADARQWAIADIIDGRAGTLGTLGVSTSLRADVVASVEALRDLLTRGGDILSMHEKLAALEALLDLPAQKAPLTKGQIRDLRKKVDRNKRLVDALTKDVSAAPATRRRGLRVISNDAPKSKPGAKSKGRVPISKRGSRAA